MEKVEVSGSTPMARFGHTITFIAKGKAILFGGNFLLSAFMFLGATGDTGKYCITGDTYSFDVSTRFWRKIDGNLHIFYIYCF